MGDAITHSMDYKMDSNLKKLLEESDVNLRKFLNKELPEYADFYNEKVMKTISDTVFKKDLEITQLENKINNLKWQIKNTHSKK